MDGIDLNMYRYQDIEQDPKKLCWNVFAEDVNAKKIVAVNIFEYNWVFINDLYGIIHDKTINTFEKFKEEVRHALMHEYWARSEYETIITTWPPYVDSEEIDRLVAEREEYNKKYGHFYCTDVRLDLGVKIDIYTQIMMNYDHFINYVWENKKKVKKVK